MKPFCISIFLGAILLLPAPAQNVNIPDQCFIDALIRAGVDSNGDELISQAEAEAVDTLITYGGCITDLTGIEAFTNLVLLDFAENQIQEVDLSELSLLESLNCGLNQLSTLNLMHNPLLNTLFCGYNELGSLDLSSCPDLQFVFAAYNQLEELDLTSNTKLTQFWCDENLISGLDVSHCSDLELFHCRGNLISTLDLSNNPLLASFNCSGNQIQQLDLSANVSLEYLNCRNNLLQSLDLSSNPHLKELDCSGNRLVSMDFSANPMLGCLDCSNNPMKSLNISNNLALDTAGCDYGYADLIIHSMPTLTQVCVWTLPFPPEGLRVDATGSPNVVYTIDCAAGTGIPSPASPKIFPKPTGRLLHIQLQQAGHYELVLTSAGGKQVRAISFDGVAFQWDLSALPSGIYVLNIRSSDYSAHDMILKY